MPYPIEGLELNGIVEQVPLILKMLLYNDPVLHCATSGSETSLFFC